MKLITPISLLFAATIMLQPAFACDPDAEEKIVGELFNSRSVPPDQTEKVMNKIVQITSNIGELLKDGKKDEACTEIEGFKTYLNTLPAK